MYIAFKYNSDNTIAIVNMETNKAKLCKRSDILNKSVCADNLVIRNGEIQGDKFKLSKLRVNGAIQIIEKQRNNKFRCIDTLGNVSVMSEDVLISNYWKGKAVNYTFSDGQLEIKSNFVKEQKENRNIHYTTEDYVYMYKQYTRLGIISGEATLQSYNSSSMNQSLSSHSQVGLYGFIESHKYIISILNKSNYIRLVKIPNRFKILDNQIIKYDDSIEFYKLTYNFNNNELNLLIHPKDKQIILKIKQSGIKLSKTTIDDIIFLVRYDKDKLKTDFNSYETFVSACQHEGPRYNLFEDRLLSGKEIKIVIGNYLIDGYKYEIRHDILIKNNGIKLIYNKYLL